MKPRSLRRVIIENVTPQIDEGRFPAKRTVGEDVVVEADAFADGHDLLAVVLLWRPCRRPAPARRSRGGAWTETPMVALGNDRWRAAFTVGQYRDYEFTVEAWI